MVKIPAEQFDIENIRREYIGVKGSLSKGLYPVEHDSIRRHEHMCHGLNPLLLDPEYGKSSKYGTNIAPGVMAPQFAGQGVWPYGGGGGRLTRPTSTDGPRDPLDVPTLGDRAINLNVTYEFLRPIKVGDHLSAQTEVADVYIKPIKLDPKAVWITQATRYYNQNDEVVAIQSGTVLYHRAPEEVAADPETASLQASA